MKNKQVKRMLLPAIYVWMLTFLVMFHVYASGNTVQIAIPVIQDFYVQSVSGEPIAQVGNYVLYPKDPESPMPEGSENGRFEFFIDGSNENTEILLVGDKAGVYHYTLRQISEDTDKYTYDKTEYTITLYIQNDADNRLSSQVIVENAEEGKCAEVRFQNYYRVNGGAPQAPATGEQSRIVFWVLLCSASLVGLLAIPNIRKKAEP